MAVFIILFDCYWLFKNLFLYLHLQAGFRQMRANQKINWVDKLQVSIPESQVSEIYHLIILPMYKEPYEVVRGSF